MKKYISSFLIAFLCFATAFAQTDSRNRVASTIVADGLAQLPAKNLEVFNRVMSEMAATGEQGVLQIAGNLKPAGDNVKNAVFEYALSGITDYAASREGAKCRLGVKAGLLKAFDKCNDETNKTFLITLIRRVAEPADFSFFANNLVNPKLSVPALAAIESMSGIDADALNLVKNGGNVPHYSLAKIIEARKLNGVEDLLISWINGADAKTKIAVYDALAAVGSAKSLKVLENATKAAGYAPDDSRALDAYLKILYRSDNKTVLKSAKNLVKSSAPATRCAGLALLLKASGNASGNEILKALKDGNVEYRNTALDFAKETAGEGIFAKVASNFSKLSGDAKVDVVKWLGNNHVNSQEAVILSAVAANDSALSCAGMEAAAKIGSPKALETLIAQLSGRNGEYASKQLLAFNGDISSGVLNVLKTGKDASVLVPALKLAGQRHIHKAYDEVAKLTGSSTEAISSAAYEALTGVVASASNYSDNVASLLEKSKGASTVKLQTALCNSLVAQNASSQYAKAAQYLKSSSHPEYYYPLLAQSGTSEALAELQKALNNSATAEAASKALLIVDNSNVIPVLLNEARHNSTYKEQLLSRFVSLVVKYEGNEVKKYQSFINALDIKPSAELSNSIISELGKIYKVQSLAVVAGKMNESDVAYAAANAVKNILAHSAELNAGKDAQNALNKAKEVALAKKAGGDADAGYAVDQITEILGKHATDGGFTLNVNSKKLSAGGKETFNKNGENIALSFDWIADGEATVVLRGVPVARLTTDKVEIVGGKKSLVLNPKGEYNTLEVRIVADRLFVVSNGESLVANAVLKETVGAVKNPVAGAMELVANSGSINLRNANVCNLPSTPVYTLSDEEKKAGFEILFDGRSLDNWQGNTTGYTPDNGTIFVTANYGGSGNLYTKKKYSDFVYRFDFRYETPGVNNGVGIRTNIGSDAAYDGMEIQILDHDDPIYAGLQPYQMHGSVYGICVPKHITFKQNTWYTEEIRAVGDRITVTVNGEVITDCNIREACKGHNVAPDGGENNPYTVDHKNHPGLFNKDGYVSFCGHGAGVRFRNIRILDLSKNAKKTVKKTTKRK